jgi:flavin-dependent dehydrogenase
MPDSLEALRLLGVVVDPDLSAPLLGIRFVSPEASVEARFPSSIGRGIRRTALHELLANRAREQGAILLWGRRITGLEGQSVKLDNGTIRARWLIGADGQNSRIRQWAGLNNVRGESLRFSFRRHYRVAPWSEFMEIHWGSGCQLYITPISSQEVCVVLICRDSHYRIDSVLDGFPKVQRHLRGAEYTSQERGALSASRSLRRVTRRSVALVGDASGSVDAITGDGLYLAFRQADALATALSAGRLASYQKSHDQLFERPALMSGMLQLLDRHPWLRRRVLATLEKNPTIFQSMLAMHVSESSHAAFAMDALLPLGWKLLQSR